MNVGILLPLFASDPHVAVRRAVRAEELGFDGVFVFDHLMPLGGPVDGASLEAFAVLGAVAAATDRVKLGTLVTRATMRPVGLLAKQAAALDAMSGGRFVLGIGTGDEATRDESNAFGIPLPDPARRRALLEQAVLACGALFRGGPWEGGDLVPAIRGPLAPPPVTPGGPPIWLGGTSNAVVELAGRIGSGWNGWGLDRARFAAKAELLAAASAAAGRFTDATWAGLALVGRDEADVERLRGDRAARGLGEDLWAGTVEELGVMLRALAGAGAAWAVLMLAGPSDRIEVVGSGVLPQVRGDVREGDGR